MSYSLNYRALCIGLFVLSLLLIGVPGRAQEPGQESRGSYLPEWNFMSLSSGRVDSFLLRHPSYDGRGVVVLIFDTGVDPSIPGLGQTSTGGPKVIDLVDVSGSNVVTTESARRDRDEIYTEDRSILLSGADRLDPAPLEGTLRLGLMEESRYETASVKDFDGDGESTSSFPVLLYASNEGYRLVLDADRDGSLAGEIAIGSYREERRTIMIAQENPEDLAPLTLAPTIAPDGQSVSFHYDMNGHGTHVAGIVSGFAISDEAGFNGVAPGAEIIGVKFSSDRDNDLTITGTMRAAYEYAAHLADSLEAEGRPVVVNMSFGIGSAYEGKADMEVWLDKLIGEHPNLYVVTSAGNSGPGLSTIGIPSAASRVITVGAALPVGIGRDAFGALIENDILWNFSSRGGEVDKPDVVAPGTAISTIPRYSHSMEASGTSMASPWVAGAVTLLLSAAAQEYPGWVPGQGLIRRALRSSAHPLEGYAPIEQGGGMVDVVDAWETLKRWKESGYADDFQEYRIETFSPGYDNGEGSTAYWRSGWTPGGSYRQEFEIERLAAEAYQHEGEFFRPYTLTSTASWMAPVQKNIFIRGTEQATVEVLYDREKLTEPGLYSGRVVARRGRGTRRSAADEVEFELVSTIIVPHRLDAANNFRTSTEPGEIEAGGLARHYLAIPKDALAVRLTLRSENGSEGNASATVVDRTGETITWLPGIDPTTRRDAGGLIAASELDGVIEVVVTSDAMEGSGGRVRYRLEMEAIMLDLDVETYRPDEESSEEVLKLTVENSGTEVLEGKWEYTVKGYERSEWDEIRSAETYRRPVTLDANDGALWVEVAFPPKEYQRSTDILIRLVDSAGAVQAEEALGDPSEWLFLPNFFKDGIARGYFLEIVFGATHPFEEMTEPITFQIRERHVRPTDPEKFGTWHDRTLYPYIPRTLFGELPELEGGIPEGYHGIGEIIYEPAGPGEERVVVEFRF